MARTTLATSVLSSLRPTYATPAHLHFLMAPLKGMGKRSNEQDLSFIWIGEENVAEEIAKWPGKSFKNLEAMWRSSWRERPLKTEQVPPTEVSCKIL
jgi:hypothetical protein